MTRLPDVNTHLFTLPRNNSTFCLRFISHVRGGGREEGTLKAMIKLHFLVQPIVVVFVFFK